jgi:hypothetical protein
MIKLFMTAFLLSAFATTGVTGPAMAQHRPCTNAPKNYIPCPTTPQKPEPSKPHAA